jgi:hypothetical protein
MTDRDPALAALDVLVGTWDTEGRHRLFEGVVTGTTTYEWLPGEHFLLQRSQVDHPSFPDGLSVFGPAESGDRLVLEYFDSRGVRRTYRVSLDGDVLRYQREGAPFDQRFTATLGGDEFTAEIEFAETPGDWQHDMALTCRRRR